MMIDNLSYMQNLSNILSTSIDNRKIYITRLEKILETTEKNIQAILQELEVK